MVQQKQGKYDAIYGGDNTIVSRAQSVAVRLSERAQAVDRARSYLLKRSMTSMKRDFSL